MAINVDNDEILAQAQRQANEMAQEIEEARAHALTGKVTMITITSASAQPDIVVPTHGKQQSPAPPGQEYVDPYLFETGHFESRAEYEELSRTAKIKPRARA